MNMLKTKLLASIKPDDLAEMLADGGDFLNIETAVTLTDEERTSIQQKLKQFNLKKAALFLNANLTPTARATELATAKRLKDEWLSAKLGKERANAVTLSDQARQRSSVEKRADEAILRMDYCLNLSAAQKDQLRAGLIERDLVPVTTEEMLIQKNNSNINMEPPVPDLSAEIEKILTPAQLKLHHQHNAAGAYNNIQQQNLVNSYMQAAQATVEEFLQN